MTYVRKQVSRLSPADRSAFIDAIDQRHGVRARPITYDDRGRPT